MNKRDHILTTLTSSTKLDELIAKMCNEDEFLIQEGKQELFVVLCELPEKRLIELYDRKRLFYWIARTLTNFYHSDRSTFYNKVRKFSRKNQAVGDEETLEYYLSFVYPADDCNCEELKYTSLKKHIAALPEFDKRLIQEFLKVKCSATKLSQKLKINYQMILRIVKRIGKELREKIKIDIDNSTAVTEGFIDRRLKTYDENDEDDIHHVRRNHVMSKDVEQFDLDNYNGPVKYEHAK